MKFSKNAITPQSIGSPKPQSFIAIPVAVPTKAFIIVIVSKYPLIFS
jgi:hypothetical protein